MKTLTSPYTEYRRYFSAFPQSGKYLKQQFCVRAEVYGGDDASVLYNTLSGEVLALSSQEDALWRGAPQSGIVADSPFWKLLASHDFIVPEGTDMMEVLERGRNQTKAVSDRLASYVSGTFNYVVLTTTECNARCFYCYEKGRSIIRMSSDVACRTAEYIEENYRKNGRAVHIQWFGGEPLYNVEAIRVICGYLGSHDIPFSSSMISNGYLLSEDIQKEAVEKWHLKQVQITLDGTEETYNSCKAFIYPKSDGSPFRRVVDNIMSTARSGIKVSIRMNVDSHNFENLLDLSEMLAGKICSDKVLQENISAYCHPLFEINAHPNYADRSRKVAEYDIALTRKIIDLGIGGTESKAGLSIGRGPKIHYCMVDNPFSFTVTPDGHLGKCEHFTDSDFVGEINGGIDMDTVRRMGEFEEYREECLRCPFPPLCHRVSLCPNIEKGVCITESITQAAKTQTVLTSLYKKCGKEAKSVPADITYSPKISDESSRISHNEYSARGKNGNALSLSFISVLQMGSHSIQAIQFSQIGDMRRFPDSDSELLKDICGIAEAYLREHPGDLLMMCGPDDARNRAVHRFAGMCFDRFGYGKDFRMLRLDGKGGDGKETLLTVFLSSECPSLEDVVEAVSRQSGKMIDYYKEISENGKRKGLQDYGYKW